MKLSAAIRIGSMTTNKIRTFFSDGFNGRCALGAAADACNIPLNNPREVVELMAKKWPILLTRVSTSYESYELTVAERIMELNDIEGMPREGIADYVETLEAKLEAPIEAVVIKAEAQSETVRV